MRTAIATKKGAESKAATPTAPDQLERLRTEAKRELATRKRREQKARRGKTSRRWADPSLLREFAWLAGRIVLAVLLPFVTLVGGSVWSYRLLGLPTWGALAVAVLLNASCLTLFGVRLTKALHTRYRVPRIGLRMGMRIALPIVAIYCGFMLLYLARENAKTDAVRSYFTSVHPLLRVALGTALLADPTMVLTETARRRTDYRDMGLPPRENSLHFAQRDGYVHAVDLRTTRRSWIRNITTRAWFGLMGLHTLRHGGTGDHLHVSLPPN